MIAAHRPGLIAIATHPDSHADYCRLAAAHGIPAVICEKPLADTLRNARRIEALEKAGPLRIITNHERRYSADYVRARALLHEGRLGALLSVRAALYMGKTKRLLDVLWHDGTHLADAIMFLSGKTMGHKKTWGAKLTGRTGTAWLAGLLEPPAPSPAGEDHRDPSVIPFVIEIGAGRDHLVFEMEFSCQRGRLRIGNGIFEVWESAESPYAERFRSLLKTQETFEGPTGYFANMLKDAIACARESARRPCSAADDGLRVIEYLHSVRRRR
jgi:predicted dehydrogenase